MPCAHDPVHGGTFDSVTLNDPTITGGTATSTTLVGATLQGAVTLDAAAAQSVREAILEVNPTVVSDDPKTSDTGVLPTEVIGDAAQLLGKPAGFFKLGDFMVPYYKKA